MIGLWGDSYYPYVDGVATAVRNYAYWLNRKYEETIIFVPGSHHKDSHEEEFPKFEFHSLTVPGLGGFRIGLPFADHAYHQKLKTCRFTLVHAHSPFTASAQARSVARRQNIPYVITFHTNIKEDFLTYTHSRKFSEFGTNFAMKAYHQADAVFAVSASAADMLRSYGFREEIIITPNGCDQVDPSPGDLAWARDFLHLSSDMPLFVFVGQLIPQKKIFEIVRAARLVTGDFRLVFCGNGSARKKLEDEIARCGLTEKVVLPGIIADRNHLFAIYKIAAALVFPSTYDASGLVVKEAGIMGTPAILARNALTTEGFTDGNTAYIREPVPEDIAAAMQEVLDDRARAAEIGRNASRLITSWEETTDILYEQYQQVVERYNFEHKK